MSSVKLTYDDYAALPDDGKRYELIDGELVELSSPSRTHQLLLRRLAILFGRYDEEHPGGDWYFAPLDVTLSEFNTFQPDLMYITPDRFDILDPRRIIGAPSLVVEILSPSTGSRDRGVKRRRYAEFGVAEYWAIDGESGHVEVYAGDFRSLRIVEPPELLTSDLVPGLAIDLAKLFDSLP